MSSVAIVQNNKVKYCELQSGRIFYNFHPMAEKITFNFEVQILTNQELSEIEIELIKKAKTASDKAYAPYSTFQVGAALLLDNDSIVLGNNQENAAYPSGLCAERVTLFHAGSNYPDQKILMLAIAAKPIGATHYVHASPCGSCRQVMFEYYNKQNASFQLLLVQPDDKIMKVGASDLLPLAFDKSTLKN
ncbi:MAG: cytidine deaminase [Cyclobacteriaceae bacterium]